MASIKMYFMFITMLFYLISLHPAVYGLSAYSTGGLLDSLNTSESIYFDFGSFELKAGSFEILEKLADELKSNNALKLLVTGHTDNIGSDEFNMELSKKRALSVREFLISRGCDPENITISARGSSEPLNFNITGNDRARNRRVEFDFFRPEQPKEAEEKDITYINASIKQPARTELKCELSVRDTAGTPVEGLKEEDVSAVLKWEKDSVPGTVLFIPIDDKKKVAFTLTMDYSPSMYDSNFSRSAPKTERILAMEQAVHSFIMNMDSRHIARLIKFGTVIDIVQPYTKTKEVLVNAVTRDCYPRPGTALFKSIYVSLKDTMYDSNPTIMKTVIAFTDGEENASGNINKDSIYRLSESKGIKVYTVGLLGRQKHSIPAGLNSKDEGDLVDIAARTGGFYWWAGRYDDLPSIYNAILTQILKSYQVSILWHQEKLPPKGTYVTAVVRVNVKGRIRTIYKDYVME